MQGTALSIGVTSPSYTGVTVPAFVQKLEAHGPSPSSLTKLVDASAVLSPDGKEIRVALLNRSSDQSFDVPIAFFDTTSVKGEIMVHEVWDTDLRAANSFEAGERVKTVTRTEPWHGSYALKKHSFQGKQLLDLLNDARVDSAFISVACSKVIIFTLV